VKVRTHRGRLDCVRCSHRARDDSLPPLCRRRGGRTPTPVLAVRRPAQEVLLLLLLRALHGRQDPARHLDGDGLAARRAVGREVEVEGGGRGWRRLGLAGPALELELVLLVVLVLLPRGPACGGRGGTRGRVIAGEEARAGPARGGGAGGRAGRQEEGECWEHGQRRQGRAHDGCRCWAEVDGEPAKMRTEVRAGSVRGLGWADAALAGAQERIAKQQRCEGELQRRQARLDVSRSTPPRARLAQVGTCALADPLRRCRRSPARAVLCAELATLLDPTKREEHDDDKGCELRAV